MLFPKLQTVLFSSRNHLTIPAAIPRGVDASPYRHRIVSLASNGRLQRPTIEMEGAPDPDRTSLLLLHRCGCEFWTAGAHVLD